MVSATIAQPSPGDRRTAPTGAPAAATASGFAGVLSTVSSRSGDVIGDSDADPGDGKTAAGSDATEPRPPAVRRDATDKGTSRQARTSAKADPSTILALAQAAIQAAPATGTPAPLSSGRGAVAPSTDADAGDGNGAAARQGSRQSAATVTADPSAILALAQAAIQPAPVKAAIAPTGATVAASQRGAAANSAPSAVAAAPVAAPGPVMAVSASAATVPAAQASDRSAVSVTAATAGAPTEAPTGAAPIAKQAGDPSAGDRESGHQQDRRGAAPAVPVTTVDAVTATVADATPTGQVLDVLQTLVDAAVSGDRTGASATGSAAADVQAPGAAVPVAGKSGIVTLELNPANLGRVTVTLRLRSDTLDVHIAVDNKDTLSVLSADKGVLLSALGTAHGSLDLAYAPAAGTTQDATTDPRTGSDGQAATDAQSGRGRRHADDPTDPSNSKVTSNESSAATAVRRDDGLYL